MKYLKVRDTGESESFGKKKTEKKGARPCHNYAALVPPLSELEPLHTSILFARGHTLVRGNNW
jgi:hypothetical protein